jgi:hypothetical protein
VSESSSERSNHFGIQVFHLLIQIHLKFKFPTPIHNSSDHGPFDPDLLRKRQRNNNKLKSLSISHQPPAIIIAAYAIIIPASCCIVTINKGDATA